MNLALKITSASRYLKGLWYTSCELDPSLQTSNSIPTPLRKARTTDGSESKQTRQEMKNPHQREGMCCSHPARVRGPALPTATLINNV